MRPLLIVLLVAVLMVALGVAAHLLWIAATVVLAFWLVGFLIGPRRQKRWYYW